MFEKVAIADSIILVVLLAAFIIIGYKVLAILKNAIIIAVLAAIFPYVLNYFGAGFLTTFDAEIRYIVIALGLYLIYETLKALLGLGKFFWATSEIILTPLVWIGEEIKKLLFDGGKEEKKENKDKRANS